ncbi:hypothetical protein LJC60_08190 [Ruminococcaceae bacterium OttesenSCG-928-D13]|nr:hypothetical protein [Ruminococcaceae bacterium OttesenSCG-928-D13]
MDLQKLMLDYKSINREFTKFVKGATIEEIAEHLKKDDKDRLLAAYLVKRLRDPKSKNQSKGTVNLFNMNQTNQTSQKKAGKP